MDGPKSWHEKENVIMVEIYILRNAHDTMFTRIKMLLALIQLYGTISKFRMVKLMFLISMDDSFRDSPYHFVPYKYGPFSFQLYADLSYLEKKEYIVQTQNSVKAKIKENLDKKYIGIIREYSDKFKDYSDKALINYIYSNYAEYTIYDTIMQAGYSYKPGIVTVGYEGLSIDQFLMKLILNKIATVVDVRKNAFSRKYGFSKNLKGILGKFGIEYIHFPALGIPSDLRRNLDSFTDYENLFCEYEKTLESELNVKIIKKIYAMGLSQKIALMCFESDVLYCHRGVIGKKLRELGAQVVDL